MSVTGHDGYQLFPSCDFDAVIMGDDFHTFGNFDGTRAHQLLLNCDFHHTKTAALVGFFRAGIFDFVITLKNDPSALNSLGRW
jgi:hypothetical protein